MTRGFILVLVLVAVAHLSVAGALGHIISTTPVRWVYYDPAQQDGHDTAYDDPRIFDTWTGD